MQLLTELQLNLQTPSDFGTTWSAVSAKMTELTNAAPMKELRRQRNEKLAETDWWGASDNTMTTAQTNYRQALRDLPDGAEPTWDGTTLGNVTWPQTSIGSSCVPLMMF